MISFIEKHNLFSNSQYGFRQSRSTALSLIDLIEEVTKKMDRKMYSGGIFIDIQKASDTMDHGIPLKNLQQNGLMGMAYCEILFN